MMMSISLIFSQENNPPEFKFSMSYDMIEVVQKAIIEPFLKSHIKNVSFAQAFPFHKNLIHGEIHNVKINNMTLDWEKSRVLALNQDEKPTMVLKNISFNAEFDSHLSFLRFLHFAPRKNTMKVGGFDIALAFGFDSFENGTAYAYIDSVDVILKTFDIHLSECFLRMMLLLSEVFGVKPYQLAEKEIENAIWGLNKTLVERSAEGHSLIFFDDLQTKFTLADLPHVFFNWKNQAFQAVPINIEVINTRTNMSAPVADYDMMPDYINDGLPLQLFMSNTMIGQFLWLVFQSGKIDEVFSTLNSPKLFPIQLNTTSIQTVFPNITAQYGENKGMYLEITKGGDYPLVFIRDGRLVTDLSVLMDFWVDTDGSQYPNQGLANCTTCDEAISLNLSIFASAVVYQEDPAKIMIVIQDLIPNGVEVLKGEVDPKKLQDLLKNILQITIIQLNLQFKDGVPNPIIGKYGINNTSIILENDYLFVGLQFNI